MSLLLGCWKAVKHRACTAMYLSHFNSSENNKTQLKTPLKAILISCVKPQWIRLQESSMPVCSMQHTQIHSVWTISCAVWALSDSSATREPRRNSYRNLKDQTEESRKKERAIMKLNQSLSPKMHCQIGMYEWGKPNYSHTNTPA